jgi:hypothetical protein
VRSRQRRARREGQGEGGEEAEHGADLLGWCYRFMDLVEGRVQLNCFHGFVRGGV